MANAISIQETTVVPTADGYAVELLVSDKPPNDETTAAFHMTLRVTLPKSHSDRLPRLQLGALNKMLETVKPLLAGLYSE